MIGKIVSIKNAVVYVQMSINIYDLENLIGKNVTFDNKYIGEIVGITNSLMEITLIGEISNDEFITGSLNVPRFGSECRLTTFEEINKIYSINKDNNDIRIGKSYVYKDYAVYLNVNSFFSSHFAILGNTGSGKSFFVSKLLQGIFNESKRLPYNPNIFLFDAYGEYQRSFANIGQANPNLNYKVITTDLRESNYEKLVMPFWLLSVDDICLLLDVDDVRQIPIVEKALKLVAFFSRDEPDVISQKNDIVARCLLDIIFSGGSHNEIRNKIVTVLTKFGTKDINLKLNLTKGGWTRTLRQCIFVDENGKFADIEVVISFLEQYCNDSFELSFPDGTHMYSIHEFYSSLEFALISEGIQSSNRIFDYANILKIRLNALINSDYVNYFVCNTYMTKADYIRFLLVKNEKKCQIINFNINYVDDRFAKVIVKIISKILFDYIVKLPKRGTIPFHLILEEAHRYVQDDMDAKILGYNIFDRITKEGRKYGILLGLISQRPSEISETSISQCSNFAIFKMFHPLDIEFVSSTIPDLTEKMVQRIKVLTSGCCILFGTAFKMPILTLIDKPDPTPYSDSCDINKTWYI